MCTALVYFIINTQNNFLGDLFNGSTSPRSRLAKLDDQLLVRREMFGSLYVILLLTASGFLSVLLYLRFSFSPFLWASLLFASFSPFSPLFLFPFPQCFGVFYFLYLVKFLTLDTSEHIRFPSCCLFFRLLECSAAYQQKVPFLQQDQMMLQNSYYCLFYQVVLELGSRDLDWENSSCNEVLIVGSIEIQF